MLWLPNAEQEGKQPTASFWESVSIGLGADVGEKRRQGFKVVPEQLDSGWCHSEMGEDRGAERFAAGNRELRDGGQVT